MSARHSDMVKEIVLALIAKGPSGKLIESMLPGVLTAFGVISRELKELEEKEYAALRALMPPVVESPRRRAKPYRVEGVEPLARPRVSGVGAAVDREERGCRSDLAGRSKNGRKAVA